MKIKKTAAALFAALLIGISGAEYKSAYSNTQAQSYSVTYAAYDEDSVEDDEAAAERIQNDEAFENSENSSEKSSASKNPITGIIVCLAIGLLIGFISLSVMKSDMKTVRSKSNATDYKKKDSFKLNESTDTFLYKKLEKTPKPQNQAGKK